MSTVCDELAANKLCVNVAALPAASRIVPPPNANWFAATDTPSVSVSPDTTV